MSIKNNIKSKLSVRTKKKIRHRIDISYIFFSSIWKLFNRNEIRVYKPIFIVGCPRSGTSISVEIIGKHPRLANWSEANDVWESKAKYYDPDCDHYLGKNDYNKVDADRIHTAFEFYRIIHRKERLVNKYPRNSVRLEYLSRMFPDAVFIHVIRDGRSVVNSIINKINNESLRQNIPFGNFCKPPNWKNYLSFSLIERTAYQWRDVTREILIRKETFKERYLEIKYEDFCEDTHLELKKIFSFIGVETQERDFNLYPVSLKSQNYKYLEKFSPEELEKITNIQKDLLLQLGYIV